MDGVKTRLGEIERCRREYLATRESDEVARQLIAQLRYYQAHGEPFGLTLNGMEIWLEHGTATTTN